MITHEFFTGLDETGPEEGAAQADEPDVADV